MTTHVSPGDAYGYLAQAQREGVIKGFGRLRHRGRIFWRIEVPSTRYDNHYGIEWAPVVLTTREVCAFVEGAWAAQGRHPTTRAGAHRAEWEDVHISPHPFSAAGRAQDEPEAGEPDIQTSRLEP